MRRFMSTMATRARQFAPLKDGAPASAHLPRLKVGGHSHLYLIVPPFVSNIWAFSCREWYLTSMELSGWFPNVFPFLISLLHMRPEVARTRSALEVQEAA